VFAASTGFIDELIRSLKRCTLIAGSWMG